MQVFLAFLIGSSLQAIVFRVMAILGLGAITFTGSQVVLDAVVQYFIDYSYELPPTYLGLMGYVWVDRALSLVVSAAVISLTITASKTFIGKRRGAS